MRTLLGLAALVGLIGTADISHSAAKPGATARGTMAAAPARAFRVGEKLTYQAKLNALSAGSATMSVEGIEDIRGQATYHTIFDVRGRVLFFHVNDHYESWFDTTNLISLHHTKHQDESNYDADLTYDFYPERKVYVRNGVENPSVAEPLDEGSFIYFMRSIPLEVGKTYEFNRYYHVDRNPVIIKVDRKEHIKVPAGEFDAIVVKPTIKSKGLFSESGQAEVWFADDSTRTLLRLKSKLSFGTLYLELKQAEYASRR
ncbi:MAG TPA: DUF3108 domain-containing protein [Gemmatimonadaceae bacterium]|nr:DUF3108 domain-containing protein [Gemmatimonadaceae bacterium]